MLALPAFVGVPGGVELLVILFVFVLLFGVPLTILLVLGYRLTGETDDDTVSDERIEELEAEVAALNERLEDDDR